MVTTEKITLKLCIINKRENTYAPIGFTLIHWDLEFKSWLSDNVRIPLNVDTAVHRWSKTKVSLYNMP